MEFFIPINFSDIEISTQHRFYVHEVVDCKRMSPGDLKDTLDCNFKIIRHRLLPGNCSG